MLCLTDGLLWLQLIELQKSKRAPPGRLRATLKPPRSRGYQCTVNAAALGIRENIRRSEDMATRLRLKLRALEQELDVSTYRHTDSLRETGRVQRSQSAVHGQSTSQSVGGTRAECSTVSLREQRGVWEGTLYCLEGDSAADLVLLVI